MRTIITASLLILISFQIIGQNLADQVTIRRTDYGVPHIIGDDLRAVSFGLAYAECEDRGDKVILPLIRTAGIWAKHTDIENAESDLYAKLVLEFTRENYAELSQDTRDILEGFAAGINYYLEKHPDEFPEWYYQEFDGVIVAAASNRGSRPSNGSARAFLRKLDEEKRAAKANADVGSNVWAFAPERTKSGKAILMRNPHLSWDAGYYEAHITVPGKVNFYGDFRIGGMFAIICGFNDHLGWSTTNNHPDLEEVYALAADPEKADHYILDGESHPVLRKNVTVEFKNGDGIGLTNKEWLYTPYGPVIDRANGYVYVFKTADWNNFRRGEQLTAMMLSKSLEEWRDVMKRRNIASSNYTYADAEGNIFYLWNASTPKLNHVFLGDTVAHKVTKSNEIWSEFQDFDKIPQLLNPKGGYLQNSNDPFHLTNLHEPISAEGLPENYPEPLLRTRSQHSLELIDNDKKLTLEDIVEMKHSMRALTAERMKEDLVKALRNENDPELSKVADYLDQWDGQFAADSRGSVVYYEWIRSFADKVGRDNLDAVEWDINNPTTTPHGISNADSAVAAMRETLELLDERYGTYDLAHGDVHRVRRGSVDVPVGGGTGSVGNFRVLWFELDEDDKYKVVGGDGWVFAVEFGKKIKAYSILAYGQSNNPDSPHFDDQAQMFAENKMKKVVYYEKDIKKNLKKSYKPGEE